MPPQLPREQVIPTFNEADVAGSGVKSSERIETFTSREQVLNITRPTPQTPYVPSIPFTPSSPAKVREEIPLKNPSLHKQYEQIVLTTQQQAEQRALGFKGKATVQSKNIFAGGK